MLSPIATTGSAPTRTTGGGYIGGGYLAIPTSASVSWDLGLAAGTWSLIILGITQGFYGTMTCTLGGTSLGTMDWTTGAAEANKSITGITVATTGKLRLTLTMNGVGPSSIEFIEMQRTA